MALELLQQKSFCVSLARIHHYPWCFPLITLYQLTLITLYQLTLPPYTLDIKSPLFLVLFGIDSNFLFLQHFVVVVPMSIISLPEKNLLCHSLTNVMNIFL